jgi:UDP-3-O-acyl N-acetylglucosamine deacetylase
MQQKTLLTEGSLKGIGLHTGRDCEVTFKPAAQDFGIQFFADGKAVESVWGGSRCTSIGNPPRCVLTVEHLLAALHGLGISNLRIEVSGGEIPGLDGSALPFVRLFKKIGIKEQSKTAYAYVVKEPLFCCEPEKAIAVYPAENFSVSYVLDIRHPFLSGQIVNFVLGEGVFEKEIAPARTFCTEEEARSLRNQGFGKGADFHSTLVISKKGPLQNHFRFPEECARHKVLDILGDLYLMGFPILGRVVGIRSGHALNRRLLEKIKKESQSHAT